MGSFDEQIHALQVLGPVAPIPRDEIRQRLAETMASHVAVGTAVAIEAALLSVTRSTGPTADVLAAFKDAYPKLAERVTASEHFTTLFRKGPSHVNGFVHGLRGKLFEEKLPDVLEDAIPGSHSWELAEDPTQPFWDLKGIGADGKEIFVQAKARVAASAGDVIESMEADGAVELFAVTKELGEAITALRPDLAGRIVDGEFTNAELDDETFDSLESLTQHLNVDVPDAVTDMLPYIGDVVLGLRLLLDVAQNERALATMKRGDKVRLHGVRAAALLARFGVTTVCTTVGGAVGAGAGTVIPGPGNAIGALGGVVAGALGAGQLNKHVQPRLLELGMKLANVSADEMFYHRNKNSIDGIGERLREQRDEASRRVA